MATLVKGSSDAVVLPRQPPFECTVQEMKLEVEETCVYPPSSRHRSPVMRFLTGIVGRVKL